MGRTGDFNGDQEPLIRAQKRYGAFETSQLQIVGLEGWLLEVYDGDAADALPELCEDVELHDNTAVEDSGSKRSGRQIHERYCKALSVKSIIPQRRLSIPALTGRPVMSVNNGHRR